MLKKIAKTLLQYRSTYAVRSTITLVIRTTLLIFSPKCMRTITPKNVSTHLSRHQALIYAQLPQNQEDPKGGVEALHLLEIGRKIQ